MYSFVARQPILNRQQQPVAYELLFRQGLENVFPNISPEQATNKLIAEQFLTQPIEHLIGNHPCFINFPESLLLQGLADSLPTDKVVIELLETATPNDRLLAKVQQMKQRGYRIALDDFTLDPRWQPFLPYIDIIKFDWRTSSEEEIRRFIDGHRNIKLQYLAEKVEDLAEFEAAMAMGCHFFQGYFFSRPEVVQQKTLNASQLTLMRLLKEVNKEEPDLDRIERLLSSDVSLSYKLLRYVNNMRYGAGKPITSFRQAAVFLGNRELRRFVSLVTTTSVGEHKSPELYHMCLVRARFCELLSLHRPQWTNPSEAFLCGLFSLLEALLDQSFEHLLQDVPVSAAIVQALVHNRGELAFYLAFIRDYEEANWPRIAKRAEKMGLNEAEVARLYLEANQWANLLSQPEQ